MHDAREQPGQGRRLGAGRARGGEDAGAWRRDRRATRAPQPNRVDIEAAWMLSIRTKAGAPDARKRKAITPAHAIRDYTPSAGGSHRVGRAEHRILCLALTPAPPSPICRSPLPAGGCKQRMNIVEPILFQCKLNPLATAICVPGSTIGSVNYGRLEKLIHNVARNALKSGIVPGNIAAILVADTILHAALILGLMHIGVTTLSLRGSARRRRWLRPTSFSPMSRAVFPVQGTVLSVDQSWMEGDGKPRGQRRFTHERRRYLPDRSDLRLHRRAQRHRLLPQNAFGAAVQLRLLEGRPLCALLEIVLRSRHRDRAGISLRDGDA